MFGDWEMLCGPRLNKVEYNVMRGAPSAHPVTPIFALYRC